MADHIYPVVEQMQLYADHQLLLLLTLLCFPPHPVGITKMGMWVIIIMMTIVMISANVCLFAYYFPFFCSNCLLVPLLPSLTLGLACFWRIFCFCLFVIFSLSVYYTFVCLLDLIVGPSPSSSSTHPCQLFVWLFFSFFVCYPLIVCLFVCMLDLIVCPSPSSPHSGHPLPNTDLHHCKLLPHGLHSTQVNRLFMAAVSYLSSSYLISEFLFFFLLRKELL